MESPTAHCRTVLDLILGPDEEHIALLASSEFDLLRRKGDLLDEGVDAVFGLSGGAAELLGICFHTEKFTPAQASHWLAGRGFMPLIFVPHSHKGAQPSG
jgi:hypothetical protein